VQNYVFSERTYGSTVDLSKARRWTYGNIPKNSSQKGNTKQFLKIHFSDLPATKIKRHSSTVSTPYVGETQERQTVKHPCNSDPLCYDERTITQLNLHKT